MGMIYRRKYRRTDGTIVESPVWWIKYYSNGKPKYESTESDKEGVAKKLLKLREGDVERGVPVMPRANRCTFDELAADVLTDYRVNGKRSLKDQERRITLHLKPFFGGRRMASINTADVRAYIDQRQAAKASNAQINRELSALKRAFTLGLQSGKILHRPHVPMLTENNTRKGFFEPAAFEAVRALLPAPLQAVISFAHITGWRIRSEVLGMQWRQVDFQAREVRLDPGTTKNGEGRVFPFTNDLEALLKAQRAEHERIAKKRGEICPWVFQRNSKRIQSFYKAWRTACRRAGNPGRIPHDFRRTAVRNLVRAGIPERVAMTMTGHKTRSVFERYNIVSPGDLRDAARRLDAVTVTTTVTMGAK